MESLLYRRFPCAKDRLPARRHPDDVIATYTAAFDAVRNREDFAQIAEKRVGKYPVFVGEGAAKATQRGTTVSAEAKAFVTNWLQEAYGVSLK